MSQQPQGTGNNPQNQSGRPHVSQQPSGGNVPQSTTNVTVHVPPGSTAEVKQASKKRSGTAVRKPRASQAPVHVTVNMPPELTEVLQRSVAASERSDATVQRMLDADQRRSEAQANAPAVNPAITELIVGVNSSNTKVAAAMTTMADAFDKMSKNKDTAPPTKVEVVNMPNKSSFMDMLTGISAFLILLIIVACLLWWAYHKWENPANSTSPTATPAAMTQAEPIKFGGAGFISKPQITLDDVNKICDDKIKANNLSLFKHLEGESKKLANQAPAEPQPSLTATAATSNQYVNLLLCDDQGQIQKQFKGVLLSDIVPGSGSTGIHFQFQGKTYDWSQIVVPSYVYNSNQALTGVISYTPEVSAGISRPIVATPGDVYRNADGSILFDDGQGNIVRAPNGATYSTIVTR